MGFFGIFLVYGDHNVSYIHKYTYIVACKCNNIFYVNSKLSLNAF